MSIYYNYILLFTIIIILSVIIQSTNSSVYDVENFLINTENNDTVIISDNYGNFNDCNMVIYPLIFDLILKQYKDNHQVTNYLLNNTTKNKLKLYIDPYINYYIFNDKNRLEYTYYEKNGYFVRISQFRLSYDECAWDFEHKTIAYTCMTDYYFIMAIIKGHRLDIKTINLLKIDYRDLISYEKLFKKHRIDVIVTYVIEDSKYVSIIEDVNYNVSGFKNMDLNRIKLFYPFVIASDIRLNNIFKKEVLALSIDKSDDMLIPSMRYIYIDNIDIIYDINNVTETFITRLDLDIDALDPAYMCYGEETDQNKGMCNSAYDINGEIKNKFTVWDKKCFKNEDCPFYKANKFYDNERGGCNDGMCELPVGIKRVGYSQFNDKGYFRPYCYNCDENNEKCCNINKIGDFAFPNDFSDRERLGKKTIISKMDYKY